MRALTSSTGAVANTYTYDAYGKMLTSTGSISNPFKYTGEYTDQESGFIYLRARYYDPESQQFLSVDPALAWTEEAYAYVGGSPTNARDPLGLCSWIPNPWDPDSCMVLGAQTEAGHWVIGGGVAAVVLVSGGFACLAGGCEAAAGALGIGAAAAESEAPAIVNEIAPAAEDATISESCSLDEILYRGGASKESVGRLTRQAEKSLADPTEKVYGISVTADKAKVVGTYGEDFASALRADVERVFRVHNTPMPDDAMHRTVELPNPVTDEVRSQWNTLFGKK